MFYKVSFELPLHFVVMDGRELKVGDTVFETDGDGKEYATIGYNPMGKNHQAVFGHDKEHDQPMYAVSGENCPIACQRKYPKCEWFF